jgi:predicted transcriptional regulator
MHKAQYNRKSMAQSSMITIRLDADLKARLEKLVEALTALLSNIPT